MAGVRRLGVILVFATLLAGCSELRSYRKGTAAAPSEPAPTKKTETAKPAPAATPSTSAKNSLTPPDYAPALYIPDAAVPPVPPETKREVVQTIPLTTPGTPAPVVETSLPPLKPSIEENPLRMLHRKAALKFDNINYYELRMRRREVVNGKAKPEELLTSRYRREPFSVHLSWIGPEAKGREVVFVKSQHGGLIHTLTAKDDVFLVGAGTRFKVAPDSMLVKGKSRYLITEAGLGPLIDRFGKLVDALERNDTRLGTAKYLGPIKRKEFEEKVEAVLHTIAPGAESLLPGGGQRLWFFDPEHGLPVLVITHDEQHREVEYYCHDRIQFPAMLDDDAFNPDVLWKK